MFLAPRLRHVRRAASVGLILAGILLVPVPASGGAMWDFAAIAGYAAGALAVTLVIYPLRRPGLAKGRRSSLWQHRQLGWAALGFALVHVALLLASQPLTARYLLPSAPLYMLCGIGGLIALGLLVATGLSAQAPRRRVPTGKSAGATAKRRPGRAVVTHSIVAAILLALIGAHIVGSGQMLDTLGKALVVCSLLALALGWSMLLPRKRRPGMRRWPIVLSGVTSAVVLMLLPAPIAGSRLLEPLLSTPRFIPVHFPHEKHTKVNCVTCHHNLLDQTGAGTCIACHRSQRRDLPASSEATFHVFCRDCHVERAIEAHRHGPTRACSGCHRSGGDRL